MVAVVLISAAYVTLQLRLRSQVGYPEDSFCIQSEEQQRWHVLLSGDVQKPDLRQRCSKNYTNRTSTIYSNSCIAVCCEQVLLMQPSSTKR